MQKRILVIEDDLATLDLMQLQLEMEGFTVMTARSCAEGLAHVRERDFDAILTDLHLPDCDGLDMVRQCKQIAPDTEIIMMTGYGSVEKALEATKAGAFYFLEKPIEIEEVLLLLDKALERKRQAEEIKDLRQHLTQRAAYLDIIGGSKAMQDIYEIIDSVAESDANVLILGESGTGKELIANAIHFKSLRAKKPLVKVNCSALPKDLIESELFGHIRGAFTGATADKAGLIGRATGGSLMLDEIGEMPLELQPKLLRVLQERVYQRLGSEKPLEADFRLICATNREPLDAVREGQLREDLYYRINTIELWIPPLRERADDVPALADHFLKEFAAKYNRPARAFSQRAHARMFEYHWPGNVRELQNTIERAVLMCKGDTIQETNLPQPKANTATAAVSGYMPPSVAAPAAALPPPDTFAPPRNLPESVSLEELGNLIVNRINEPQPGQTPEDLFNQLEKIIVRATLQRTKGNKQAAANLLGLYRPRLYGMIKRHELE